MEDSFLGYQDVTLRNMKIREYMSQLISKNNNQRCSCCPYGYHVNLDFVEFAKDISNSHNELQKIRRYQRKLERAQNNILNSKESTNENLEEILIAKQSVVQELTCSSSGINCSNIKIASQFDNDEQMTTKEQKSNTAYISESGSQSSDESPSFQSDLNNSNSRNILKDATLQEDYRRKYSKGVMVSYEHLTSIREQMAASLRRVQQLETEASDSLDLRHRLKLLDDENDELHRQLTVETTTNNDTSTIHRRISAEASQWNHLSDIPQPLLANIERILYGCHHPQKYVQTESISVKPQSTQTDVNGTLIVDTLSFLTYSTNDSHCQSQHESPTLSPKIHRRNFGVTVRPAHNHFTQQISFSSRSFKPDESLSAFLAWTNTMDDHIDRQIGSLLHNIMSHYFKNSYKDAVDLLKAELLRSLSNYKSYQSSNTQTATEARTDSSTQVIPSEYNRDKSVHAYPVQWNKYTSTRPFSVSDSSVETDRLFFVNNVSQTSVYGVGHRDTQTDFEAANKDVFCQHVDPTMKSHISTTTDCHLIDELISEQIEDSMYLIQEELKIEIESKLAKRHSSTCMTTCEIDSCTKSFTHEYQECHVASVSHEVQQRNICVEYRSNTTESHISGKALEQSLVRSKIDSWNVSDDRDYDSRMVQSSSLVGVNSALVVDTYMENDPMSIEDKASDKTDSIGSSPMEGCYYTADNRIDYGCINQIDEDDEDEAEKVESVTEIEENLVSTVDSPLMIDSNSIKQDEDTYFEPEFPEKVKYACCLVATWMNDSTTTCSKDLNDSFAVIRQFWFDVIKNNRTDLKICMDMFRSYSVHMMERIINMVDSSGNTCLHYAVSQGRWPIVLLIMEIDQADLCKINKVGYTVLMLASVPDVINEDALRLLISKSEIDKRSENESKQTALMIAASRGKSQLVQLLLEAGSSINMTDSDGSSPLMCACDNGHLEVVRLLLSRPDIDTELEDNTGANAIKIAFDNSRKDIALLIFARHNLPKGSSRSKRRSGSSSHPTSPLNARKFK